MSHCNNPQNRPRGQLSPSASPGALQTPESRLIRGRRYPSTPRLRTFHTARPLAQASNPPPAPNNSTPTDQDGATSTDRDKAAAAEEPADGAVALEDPDLLAQKLLRSRETTRRYSAALRRQQRSKKAQGLPPVHVPDWFLKNRVLRREDVPGDPQDAKPPTLLSVAVTHVESGEQATCAIPARRDSDTAQLLSRLIRGLWSRRLDDNEKHKVEKYLEERMALDEKVDKQESQSRIDEAVASTEAGRPGDVPVTSITEDSAFTEDWTKLSKLQKDSAMDLRKKVEEMRKLGAKLGMAARKREVARSRQSDTPKHLSSLVVAEVRANIAACLSALQPAAGDSFPAAKTNLIFHSPAPEHEGAIDACVVSSAFELGADVIVLGAQDLAQLAGDYLGEGAEPSPRSIRSLGYETYRLNADVNDFMADVQESGAEDESDWSQSSPMDQSDPNSMRPRSMPLSIIALTPALRAMTQDLKGLQLGSGSAFGSASSAVSEDSGRNQSQSEMQLEDMKLAALLETLVDSSEAKQSRGIVGSESLQQIPLSDHQSTTSKSPAFFDYSLGQEGAGLDLNSTLPVAARPNINFQVKVGQSPHTPNVPQKSKIIYVKDFKELNATHYGGRIIQKLEELVRRRRIAGESIMIVGNTCSRDLTPELNPSGVRGLQSEGESSFFRTIVIAPEFSSSTSTIDEAIASLGSNNISSLDIPLAEKSKFQHINLYHIRDMLRSLDPSAAANISDMDQSHLRFREWAPIFSESHFNRVLTYDEVHRVALTALGLLVTSPVNKEASSANAPVQLSWAHVALAMGLLKASDTAKYTYFERIADMTKRSKNAFSNMEAKIEPGSGRKRTEEKNMQRQRNLQRIASTANKHEKRLMPGIADPDQIKTTFEQVHVPTETVDSIRTITSLSLLRPEAFSYGILATEKISGALLYGPPGTGKTLLAKAVAKESGSSVLEVSGSQIMDKYVGEGEKNVAAIFSLARKLSPCIVFLDEADAVFASRDAMRERASHRDILNQFLKEWDGLNDLSVFVMVATNRPFDLDDAVIRRLPRRLLVDLPTQADRKEILRIHLKGEQLDESVDLEDIAKRTPFYSGSDLKNIAVSAALACVKEENEQAAIAAAKVSSETNTESASSQSEADTDASATTSPASSEPDSSATSTSTQEPPQTPRAPHLVRGQSYTFPEKRILHPRHFDKALQEISASISEDMSSLNAIKKFDEQYGDRKGNKRRKDFGFGMATERNESAARVRI
ncbi:AAA-domain-containing protein [Stemphylium lycopersici]|nr:AAA-domain-containing protein [Stemphylium lycopersici]